MILYTVSPASGKGEMRIAQSSGATISDTAAKDLLSESSLKHKDSAATSGQSSVTTTQPTTQADPVAKDATESSSKSSTTTENIVAQTAFADSSGRLTRSSKYSQSLVDESTSDCSFH